MAPEICAALLRRSVPWNVSIRVVAAALSLLPMSDSAGAGQSAEDRHEPTQVDCTVAVEKARALTIPLPEGHLSRVFAERYLHQSMTEAGNGEYDDCLYWAQKATDEIEGRQHDWRPGERLKVLGADKRP